MPCTNTVRKRGSLVGSRLPALESLEKKESDKHLIPCSSGQGSNALSFTMDSFLLDIRCQSPNMDPQRCIDGGSQAKSWGRRWPANRMEASECLLWYRQVAAEQFWDFHVKLDCFGSTLNPNAAAAATPASKSGQHKLLLFSPCFGEFETRESSSLSWL